MAKSVTPSAFMIAQTTLNQDIVTEALKCIGAPTWKAGGDTDADKLTEIGGKLCYMSFDTALNQNLTTANARPTEQYIQEGIIAHKHGSVLEHSSVTFLLCNVSRVVTHELVRHRAGTAFSQVSGRYVRSNEIQYYLPIDIKNNERAATIFQRAFEVVEAQVESMADQLLKLDSQPFALKKSLTSALRRLIGTGATNHILMTGNHRAWRHIIEMRVNEHAEEEIRIAVGEIARQLQFCFPIIYADMTITLDAAGLPTATFKHSKV